MKIKETKDNFNTKFLPLTTNENNFGKLLIKGDCLPYIDKINNQRETVYKDKMNTEYINTMYLYKNTYVIINTYYHEYVHSCVKQSCVSLQF